jgi:hypothetical protein
LKFGERHSFEMDDGLAYHTCLYSLIYLTYLTCMFGSKYFTRKSVDRGDDGLSESDSDLSSDLSRFLCGERTNVGGETGVRVTTLTVVAGIPGFLI